MNISNLKGGEKKKEQTFLKALLIQSKHQHELLRFLPSPLAEEVQNISLQNSFDSTTFFSASQWSINMHYSWFAEVIKGYPLQVRYLFLNALTTAQSAGIQNMLSLSDVKSTPTSPFLKSFIMNILRQTLQEPDLLSEEFLPPSALNCLLSLERKYLFHVIDLLGLHDLAADLRQVVDKTILKKIHSSLTAEQLHFLHYCSRQSVKWVSPKLGLLAWNGSKQQLKSLLHYRGLIRLAKATWQEDSSYKWHLLHRMDIGRAKIIQKMFYQKQDPALLPFFKTQVLHIAKRYQQ